MKPFKSGDTVQLKCGGGPAMGIAQVKRDPFTQQWKVRCVWFDDQKHCQTKWVPVCLLVLVGEASVSVSGVS